MKNLQKIHTALKAIQERYNEQYYRFSFNGGRKPLPLEIQVRRKLNSFIPEYGKETIKAYWMCCWWRGLCLPSREMVERFLETGEVKGEIYEDRPDKRFKKENGNIVSCHFTGFEVICVRDPLHDEWFSEYTDSEGNLYYAEIY